MFSDIIHILFLSERARLMEGDFNLLCYDCVVCIVSNLRLCTWYRQNSKIDLKSACTLPKGIKDCYMLLTQGP